MKRNGVIIPILLLIMVLFVAASLHASENTATAETIENKSIIPSPQDDGSSAMSGKIGKQSLVGRLFSSVMMAAGKAAQRIASIGGEIAGEENFWSDHIGRLTHGKGIPYLIKCLFGVIAIICFGVFVEWMAKRFTEEIRHQVVHAIPTGVFQKIGRILSHFLLKLLGVGFYIGATFVAIFLSFGRDVPGIYIVSAFVISSYYFRFIALFAVTILSPSAPALRILPLSDENAAFFQQWIFRIAATATLFASFSSAFQLAGNDEIMSVLSYCAAGGSIMILLMLMIGQGRRRVADAIRAGAGPGGVSAVRERFAERWHYFALLYVLVIGVYWVGGVLVEGKGALERLMLSILLIPMFVGVDQWGQMLIDMFQHNLERSAEKENKGIQDSSAADTDVTGEDEQAVLDAEDTGMDMQHFIQRFKPAVRVLFFAFMFFLTLRLWGIDLRVGRFFTSTALSILVTLALGVLTWEYIKSLIDRKIEEEMPEEDEESEGEGAGGSRKGTLLVLLRKFILTVLFVIVALIILSSIGIEIGPLIAGAGVIGLAIGFGAQTLVKDIISGVFFLVDDAFRVGDYVETAGVKGAVEQISLRSMRLRHPRGMIHTIPFSDMKTVTNFSRDYHVMKLDFRVRYDTDVEKVRKLIKKKVYKEILKNEELAPKLLGKIKSQGVRQMDDSAMIMRVKFKTFPGEQFVIRKEVFRRIQEAFREEGIEFAHRNVTVYMPPETGESMSAEEKKDRAEAAAAAAALDEAKQKK